MAMRWRSAAGAALVLLLALLAGCSRPPAAGGRGAAAGPLRVEFWHTRRGDQEKALQAICAEYQAGRPGVELVPIYQGGYDELNKIVRASIQGGGLPALAVAYESQVNEYMQNGVIVPVEEFVRDPELGLSADELTDIPESYLASNRFPQFGNRLLSFPFTKSSLVLYHNLDLMKQAGFTAAPVTWEQFEQQAAAITARLGKPAFAFDLDPSTLDGLVFSFGGDVLGPDGRRTLFDQPPAVRALELLQRMARARALLLTTGDEAGALFIGGQCAFLLGSSAGRARTEKEIDGAFDWDVSLPPRAGGAKPVTVMYGPNVCIFKTTPEQQEEAWRFVRHFVSPAVTARWARETGYLPVRLSAAALPEMKSFYETNARARHVYETLQFARGEPNVLGWQEVRSLLQDAARSVITKGTSPQQAGDALRQAADRRLAESR